MSEKLLSPELLRREKMVGRVRIRTHTKLMGVLQTLGLTHVRPTRGLRGRICAGKRSILRRAGIRSRHTEEILTPRDFACRWSLAVLPALHFYENWWTCSVTLRVLRIAGALC